MVALAQEQVVAVVAVTVATAGSSTALGSVALSVDSVADGWVGEDSIDRQTAFADARFPCRPRLVYVCALSPRVPFASSPVRGTAVSAVLPLARVFASLSSQLLLGVSARALPPVPGPSNALSLHQSPIALEDRGVDLAGTVEVETVVSVRVFAIAVAVSIVVAAAGAVDGTVIVVVFAGSELGGSESAAAGARRVSQRRCCCGRLGGSPARWRRRVGAGPFQAGIATAQYRLAAVGAEAS